MFKAFSVLMEFFAGTCFIVCNAVTHIASHAWNACVWITNAVFQQIMHSGQMIVDWVLNTKTVLKDP